MILEIEAPERDLDFIEVNPEWPNPEDYENVRRFPIDADAEDGYWRPESVRVLDDEGPDPMM